MHRSKVRGRGQEHHVHIRFKHLPVGFESGELVVGIYLNSVAYVLLRSHGVKAPLQAVLEGIGDRHEMGTRVGPQGLNRGAAAPPAATHQTDSDDVIGGGMGVAGHRQGRGQRSAQHRGTRLLEKIATGFRRLVIVVSFGWRIHMQVS